MRLHVDARKHMDARQIVVHQVAQRRLDAQHDPGAAARGNRGHKPREHDGVAEAFVGVEEQCLAGHILAVPRGL
jgi:hypothetical protein